MKQIRRLAAATAHHIRAAVVVVAGTGLRQRELFGLTVDRIRSDEDRVRAIVDDSLGASAEDWLRTG